MAMPFLLGELDGLGVQHLGTCLGHFLRLFIGQRADALRPWDDTRIGGIHAIDIGTDLAVFGIECGSHGHSRGVAAAPSERCDFFFVRDALIPGNDDDLPARELVLDAKRPHFDDARIDVAIVGDDAGLAAGKADRVAAALANRHREERHGDAFASREQHVELAAIGIRGDFLGQRQQVVGGISHRRDDDHDVVAELARGHDSLGDSAQLVDVGNAAPPILLNDDCHIHI
jgi:hypothetical protein